jgi:hypothetical protein
MVSASIHKGTLASTVMHKRYCYNMATWHRSVTYTSFISSFHLIHTLQNQNTHGDDKGAVDKAASSGAGSLNRSR